MLYFKLIKKKPLTSSPYLRETGRGGQKADLLKSQQSKGRREWIEKNSARNKVNTDGIKWEKHQQKMLFLLNPCLSPINAFSQPVSAVKVQLLTRTAETFAQRVTRWGSSHTRGTIIEAGE